MKGLWERKFSGIRAAAAVVAIVTGLATGINLFGYPYLGGDEGIYVSQGWWSVKYGELAPYVYTYDHSPFGWIQIGLWQMLTGGPFTFGMSVAGGRVLMLLMAMVTNVFIFDLTRRITGKTVWGLAAASVFALSPLSVYNHRLVLLDNIATLWLVVAVWMVVAARSRLIWLWLGGVVFGWSVLSKEVAAVLLPALVWAVYMNVRRENRSQAILVFVAGMFGVVIIYPLMAILRGEFLPPEWWGGGEHVSLIGTLIFQAGRGAGKVFWEAGSDFRKAWSEWFIRDPVLMFLGAWSMVVNLITGFKNRVSWLFAAMGLLLIGFLVRGGVILGFYVVPLIAVWAVGIALAIRSVAEGWGKRELSGKDEKRAVVLLGIMSLVWVWGSGRVFTVNQTKSQIEAVSYIKQKIEPNKIIVGDMYPFLDLRLENKAGPAFPNYELLYRVDLDPTLKKEKLDDRWQNIDYLMVTVGMLHEMKAGFLPFVKQAYARGKVVADFASNQDTFRDLVQMDASDGDWVTLVKVDVPLSEKTRVSRFGGESGRRAVGEMSVEEKVAGLMWVSIPGREVPPEYKEWLAQGLGGVVIREGNVGDEEGFGKFVEEIRQASGGGAVVVSDEEGGSVSRLAGVGVDDTSQRAITSPDLAYGIAYERAVAMKRLGVTVNLAPVVERVVEPDSFLARQGRGFGGSDEKKVAELSVRMVDGLRDGGVAAVVKHFPGGLGRTATDPHRSLPVVSLAGGEDYEAEMNKDIYPFERTVGGGVKAVMVTHVLYPEVDGKMPASLSPVWIEEILRNRLGFSGVVVADDVSMGALDAFTEAEKARLLFLSGVDVVIVTGDYMTQREIYEAMVDLVKSGEVSEARLDEGVSRAVRLVENAGAGGE